MIDLHTPRYSGAEAAKACGVPVTTFRSYFARGHFRVVGDSIPRDANGLPHLFSLRDVVGLAIALRLMDNANIAPMRAFHIGGEFAHIGDRAREPGRAFNFHELGETAVIYWPQSDRHRIMPFDALTSADLFRAKEKAVCVLLVNYMIGDVYSALGLDPQEGITGSAPPPAGTIWDEVGEIVPE